MRDIHQRAGGPIDWDREWETVWKATARNPWFAYQADVYDAWLGPSSPAARVLKTDAFDEACGYGPLAHPGRLALLDVAPRILRQALGAYPDAIGCVADVRRLAFRDGAFDLVFSPSTLDHFEDPHDIDTALAELARVLHPGGRLLVTLDNPGNPLLAARRAIRRLTGPMRGLIPWPVGRTLSRARLVAALERAGLDVVDSGWVVHAPRLLGLWLGEWAARRGRDRLARRLRAAFNRIERAAARLPTGGLTAHFVVADCRRPLVPAPRPRGSRLVAAGTALWKRTEFRLRTAYLRRVPPPLVSLFDPPLRRVVGVGRRAAALPVYFRQRLALWSGPCAGGTARVAVWGKADAPRRLFDILFDGRPAVEWHGARLLSQVLRGTELDADLFVAETTPYLAPLFRRRGFLVVPGMVRFTASIEALLATAARPSKSLRANLTRAARIGCRAEVRPFTEDLSRLYYHRYLVPHALARFREGAMLPSYRAAELRLRAGLALLLLPPGGGEPVAIGVAFVRGRVLWLANLGTRDGDPAIVAAGGVAALYEAMIRLAQERGLSGVDAGRARPWQTDGVASFKSTRGFRPTPDGGQTLEYAVRILRPESRAARRLAERRVFVRVGRRVLALSPDGTLSEG